MQPWRIDRAVGNTGEAGNASRDQFAGKHPNTCYDPRRFCCVHSFCCGLHMLVLVGWQVAVGSISHQQGKHGITVLRCHLQSLSASPGKP